MKKLFQNVLVLIASLLLTFTMLELVVRIVKGDFTFKGFKEYKVILSEVKKNCPAQYDPYLGWIPREGYSISKDKWGARITVLKNGIRSNGSETIQEATAPAAILAVGDSFTFGGQVSDSDTWPAFLEKMSGKKVVNGGVNSYGLDQIFLRANELIKKYKPDILILSCYVGDIDRCHFSKRHHEKPYFEIINNGLVLKNNPVPVLPRKRTGIDPVSNIFTKSVLIKQVIKSAFPDYWRLCTGEFIEAGPRSGGEQIAYLLFRHLREIIQANTVRHIFVLLQYNRQMSRKNRAMVKRVISGIHDRSIKVVDLWEPFQQVMQHDRKRWDSFFNGHMTPEGNRFVARELQKALNEACGATC